MHAQGSDDLGEGPKAEEGVTHCRIPLIENGEEVRGADGKADGHGDIQE